MASAAFAGTSTYSGKEMKQVEQAPCPTWYADNEWNVGISGVYAWNVDDDDNDNFFFNNESWDDAWGGALDVKYFFRRNFGVGVQAFGLSVDNDFDRNPFGTRLDDDDNDDWNWGALGTFTMRFPIACSRFSPYIWAGAGGYWTDNDDDDGFFQNFGDDDENDGRFMGQFGAGFEVRFSQHVGLTTDIAYNDVEGGDHDFIQVRAGLNFAF
jgi:outer membrane protein W